MPHLEPLEVPGTVFIGDLLQGARDLIENPDDNPEYTRGILELLHDATGEEIGALRDIIFPKPAPLVRYAIELIGGVPEDTTDWQQVAQELYDELHPTTTTDTPEEPEDPTVHIVTYDHGANAQAFSSEQAAQAFATDLLDGYVIRSSVEGNNPNDELQRED